MAEAAAADEALPTEEETTTEDEAMTETGTVAEDEATSAAGSETVIDVDEVQPLASVTV